MTDDIVRSHYQRRPDGITLANWRDAPHNRWAFQHVGTLVPSVEIPSAAIDAGESREDAREELGDLRVGSHRDGTRVRLDELLVRSETTVLEVMKNGRRVYEWAAPHRDANAPHLLFSVTKSLTALLAGVLVGQGALDENAPVTRYVPECAESAYGDATVRHLLDMTVCAAFDESYLDRSGDYARYRVATAWNPTDVDSDGEDHDRTAGLHDFLPTIPRGDGAHGARVHYLSPNTDLLGWVLERAGGARFHDVFGALLWQPLGAAHSASMTVDHYGAARTAGGLSVMPVDLARVGQLVLAGGAINGRQIVPEAWIADLRAEHDRAAWRAGDLVTLFPEGNYRSQWYQSGRPSGAICGIGIHGQWLWVDPVNEVVVVRLAAQAAPVDEPLDHTLVEAFEAIASAL